MAEGFATRGSFNETFLPDDRSGWSWRRDSPPGAASMRPRLEDAGARERRFAQIENDIPQPHVVAAFGLLITNRDPCKSSL